MQLVNGYKTYLMVVLALAYALYGHFVLHTLDANTMVALILGSLQVAGLRHAITKVQS